MVRDRSYCRWWIAAAAALILIPLLFYLMVGGRMTGHEFSPDDFSHRYFSYNQMPWFHLPLRGIEYRDATPVFEQMLYADGLIGKVSQEKRWHLVSDSGSNPRSTDFDARFLCRYLDLKDENGECFWIGWNRRYPELSSEFWPIIADLARGYLYLDVAAIMQPAMSVSDESVPHFREYLVETATTAFVRKGNQCQVQENDEQAIAWFDRAIEIRPSVKAFLARAVSHNRLGNEKLSELDRQRAKEIIEAGTDLEEHATDLPGQ